MRSAAKGLTKIVGKRTNIGSCRDFDDKFGTVSDDTLDLEATNFHFYRFEVDGLIAAGKFVRGDTVHLLRGIRRRRLQNVSSESWQVLLNLGERRRDALYGANGLTFGIVCIGRKAKTYLPFIHFGGIVKELGEASKAANHQWQDSGGHRIEGSEVADAALSDDAADAVDDIVRCEVGGFV